MMYLSPLFLLAALASSPGKDDLFRGKPLVVQRQVEFLFRAGADKFVPPRNVGSFDCNPSANAPAGLAVKILSAHAEPVKISGVHISTSRVGRTTTTTTGTGEGYRIRFSLELSAGPALGEGEHVIDLSFPGVAHAASRLGVANPLLVSTVKVNFWESPASRKAHLERKAAEAHTARLLWWGSALAVVAGIVLVIWVLRTLGRAWTWGFPRHRLETGGAGVRVGVTRTIVVPLDEIEKSREPLAETYEAQTFWGRKSGVTVHCHGVAVDCEFHSSLVMPDGRAALLTTVNYEALLTAKAGSGASTVALAETPAGTVKVGAA